MGGVGGSLCTGPLHCQTAGHVIPPNRITSDSFHFQLVTIFSLTQEKLRPQFPPLGSEGVNVGYWQSAIVCFSPLWRCTHHIMSSDTGRRANLARSAELSVVAQAASLRADQKNNSAN